MKIEVRNTIKINKPPIRGTGVGWSFLIPSGRSTILIRLNNSIKYGVINIVPTSVANKIIRYCIYNGSLIKISTHPKLSVNSEFTR